ncbi:hypothetical protein [Actinoplanes sp. NPDC048796]|uniref:hypothetical protein n=1 Tax=Actinoplanes sp. NPDC048796 TaxID=3155640 RepID=UPI0033F00F1A
MTTTVAGFLTIHVIDKALELPHFLITRSTTLTSARPVCSPRGLVGHSFFDGLSIWVSFGAAVSVATAVAVAVLAHDLTDGFNTYTLTVMSGGGRRRAAAFLLADAVAPVVGAGRSSGASTLLASSRSPSEARGLHPPRPPCSSRDGLNRATRRP